MNSYRELPRDTNQARGIGEYAVEFLKSGAPADSVLARTQTFFTDAVLCGLSAIALQTNAPTILAAEAREYADPAGATLLGSSDRVKAEKAIVANGSAVREWDSNGTNFGYRPERGWTAGEFGHNDFYSVPVAAAQESGLNGATALLGMVLVDEIRGRLAEVFSLKSYRIDHVVHGAIASAATYGAIRGATAEQIESAIGMFVAHYIPWRAIRAGKQLSDSKGASAAISTEAAVLCMKRAMQGFIGPADIFRNPESLFRQFQPTNGDSPFDLSFGWEGDDFAIQGMHLKLGLYEHQSAGAIQAVISMLADPQLRQPDAIQRVIIRAYEPAFSIIGDPAKRNPKTRQSADHSMAYIVARTIKKAVASNQNKWWQLWEDAMLLPEDYNDAALQDPDTRAWMDRIEFQHGGPEYDAKYPEGIPTSVELITADRIESSGLVMFPLGHARHDGNHLNEVLETKWLRLAEIAGDPNRQHLTKLSRLPQLSADELIEIYTR